MLKIQRSSNRQVVYKLSGEIDKEQLAELEALIRSEADGRVIVLDLKNLILVGRDAISFLGRCEAGGIRLQNCAAYVREWITRELRGN
jgi:anti-anti-sigma regulatory factor